MLPLAVRRIEALRPGIVSWAYWRDGHGAAGGWFEVGVNHWETYMDDKKYSMIADSYRRLFRALGFKVVFFYQKPTPEMLYEKEVEGNLVMNL